MMQSVIDDIRDQFRYGNKIVQLILVNFFVFLIVIVARIILPGFGTSTAFQEFFSYLALPSDLSILIRRPWTLFTHMFVHKGLWHLAWNMLMLYWFGRIYGDLLGDKKVLPLYIVGGIFGALFYLLTAQLAGTHGIAFGASGAVMAFVVAAACVAPDYSMRLLLLGDVKLKYIAIALVFLNFVSISEGDNVGGSIAHLGGAVFGAVYVYLLRQGIDLLAFAERDEKPSRPQSTSSAKRAPMKVVHSIYKQKESTTNTSSADLQDRVDAILDKINATGYESLTAEEKDILYRASKS